MEDIIKLLNEMDDFDCLDGASQEEIEIAEADLNLRFAPDYKEYLLKCGLASAAGHEFTGIVKSPRLNVVDVTAKIQKRIKGLPSKSYVVEELNIDNIAILQTSDGAIYEAAPDKSAKKIADSLIEYLKDNK